MWSLCLPIDSRLVQHEHIRVGVVNPHAIRKLHALGYRLLLATLITHGSAAAVTALSDLSAGHGEWLYTSVPLVFHRIVDSRKRVEPVDQREVFHVHGSDCQSVNKCNRSNVEVLSSPWPLCSGVCDEKVFQSRVCGKDAPDLCDFCICIDNGEPGGSQSLIPSR